MPIFSYDKTGVSMPAVLHADSKVLSVSTSKSLALAPTVKLVTIACLTDIWMRAGIGAQNADGLDGCALIPGGQMWPEPVLSGATLAFATVDGSTANVVVRFAAE